MVNTTLYELNADRIEEIKSSPFFWIERTADSTVEDTVALSLIHILEDVEMIISQIISIPLDDGVSFRVKRISEIMEEADYPLSLIHILYLT